ncbi:unnamed protein product [Dovyalis caffra]|uniref:ATPase inhibitor n=1 Tax=Dovyalis caffra TaxID=77055 RepID=A0AAV1QTW2_9ROSI|nr:unnamed protein product [Dovyalis caffra]
MATRSALSRLSLTATRSMESTRGATRYFSDDKGKILSEEERAAENIYIQKMERERLEKLKLKQEKEKAEKEKQGADKVGMIVTLLLCVTPMTIFVPLCCIDCPVMSSIPKIVSLRFHVQFCVTDCSSVSKHNWRKPESLMGGSSAPNNDDLAAAIVIRNKSL